MIVFTPIGGGSTSTDPGIANVLSPASGGPTNYVINGDTLVGTLTLDFPTASQIADAVWDEMKADHTLDGSFGAAACPSVDDIVSGIINSGGTGAPGVTVSPANNPVLDSTLQVFNVDGTTPGSITYEIVDDTHLKIILPSTADARNGDYLVFNTTNTGDAFGQWYYIILAIDGVELTISGDWVIGDNDFNPRIYVDIATGATAEENSAALQDALDASSKWGPFGMSATSEADTPGIPSVIANSVWNSVMSAFTTSGTFGDRFKKLLTVAKFLGLK